MKPATSPAGSFRSRGFTLLELLLVMALAAILMVLVPPMISSALPGTQLKSAARELAAGLRYARTHALTSREEALLTLDAEQRHFKVSGRSRTYTIPDSVDISMLTAESETRGDRIGAIRFFPDGGSTGGRISLRHGERGFGVDVDWLTGKVRILDLEPEY
ncbi:GspH/FimT family pseudopilin [Thiolapillus brandeum]|uniref:GspH/FimT family pseudopilin n=1 Tax=Thiolapillus brandeum TaxID=1076588 RepID=UPI001CB7A55C|nr:GspH/FimT family protein [Thiolapillus brandeum]